MDRIRYVKKWPSKKWRASVREYQIPLRAEEQMMRKEGQGRKERRCTIANVIRDMTKAGFRMPAGGKEKK